MISINSKVIFLCLVGAVVTTAPLLAGFLAASQAENAILISEPLYASGSRDPVTINTAAVDGDTLVVEVSFGGGCGYAEHGFALIASPVFMESYPVQVDVLLSHDAKGDVCEALLTKELVFDLSPLKKHYQEAYGTVSGEIVIHLNGEVSVNYGFSS